MDFKDVTVIGSYRVNLHWISSTSDDFHLIKKSRKRCVNFETLALGIDKYCWKWKHFLWGFPPGRPCVVSLDSPLIFHACCIRNLLFCHRNNPLFTFIIANCIPHFNCLNRKMNGFPFFFFLSFLYTDIYRCIVLFSSGYVLGWSQLTAFTIAFTYGRFFKMLCCVCLAALLTVASLLSPKITIARMPS